MNQFDLNSTPNHTPVPPVEGMWLRGYNNSYQVHLIYWLIFGCSDMPFDVSDILLFEQKLHKLQTPLFFSAA